MAVAGGRAGFADLGGGHYEVFGRGLVCPTCMQAVFEARRGVLDTRGATFFNLAWANRGKTDFICRRCGHIQSFTDE